MKKVIFGLFGIVTALTLTFGSPTSQETQNTTDIIQYTHGHTG
ncbi:hypothetical protein QUF88_14825 [Bacillus sp. DX1.1]|nr:MULTISPECIES: hypothetical protein [unclassified Bacillus (in: firmicutes)]MDM5155041.1 hypothetical protein [Bacillus sp. DX1.1]WJE83901.1 hypothetical protein QRE67_12320 [Bacillus sp. DX3.1]